jgi:hypothetical protein
MQYGCDEWRCCHKKKDSCSERPSALIKVMIRSKNSTQLHSIPVDIARPSIFRLPCVGIDMSFDFSEDSFDIHSKILLLQDLPHLPMQVNLNWP